MSTNDRDTHFAGFAKLLWHEIRKTSFDSPGFSEYQQLERHLQLLIAQRAYDLAYHILTHETMDVEAEEYRSVDEVLANDIPDMTAWTD